MTTLQDRIRRAEQAVQVQSEQATGAKMGAAVSIGATIFGALLGRKAVSAGTLGRATTAARGMGRIGKESQDVARATENVGALKAQLRRVRDRDADRSAGGLVGLGSVERAIRTRAREAEARWRVSATGLAGVGPGVKWTPGRCHVEALRGDTVESVHRVHVAVAHAEQGLIASAGNPAHHSFVRSSIKMFQVLPFVEAGGVERFQLTGEELALCTRVAWRRAVSRRRRAIDPRQSQGHRSRARLRSASAAARADRQRHVARRRSTRAHPQQLFGQACRHARALRPAAMGHERLPACVASHAAARAHDAGAVDADRRRGCRRWLSMAAACRRSRSRLMRSLKAARDSRPRSPPANPRRRRSSTRWSRIRNSSPAPIASTPT